MPFKSLGLHDDLVRAVKELGFTRPTPIQEQAIPVILQGRDILGGAQTGTGKTAAFLLPILHRLLTHPSRGGTRALVLTPTRELALQVMDDFKDLGRFTTLRGAAVLTEQILTHQRRIPSVKTASAGTRRRWRPGLVL